jgi:hypothetical protein
VQMDFATGDVRLTVIRHRRGAGDF